MLISKLNRQLAEKNDIYQLYTEKEEITNQVTLPSLNLLICAYESYSGSYY